MVATRPNSLPLAIFSHLTAFVRHLWTVSPVLTAYGFAMLFLLVLATAGTFLDPRVISGSPAWLKPTKFALSFVFYAFTLTWMLGFVKGHRRLVSVVTTTVAVAALIEMVIIVAQVVRGTSSHFNVGTPLDATLFTIMGVTIVVLWVMTFLAALLLLFERLKNPAFAWSLRLGLIITLVGMAQGTLMLRPTSEQRASWVEGQPTGVVGAHSVGVPDGGPGLPITGWSTEGGDLRVGHFVGMHALQVIPLFGWLIAWRRWPLWSRTALIFTVALGYLGLVALVTWQALRGQALLEPDGLTLLALFGLIALAALAAAANLVNARRKEHVHV